MTAASHDVLPGDGADVRGVLCWRLAGPDAAGDRGGPWPALSSASVGGGLSSVGWVLNIGVVRDYRRTDLEAHARAVADRAGLTGPGTALFTAADVTGVRYAECEGVRAWSTVGVSRPTWPADRAALAGAGRRLPAGTINTVVLLPAPCTASALAQAALVVAEAKAQACLEAGIPGTGTASDAVVVACPPPGPGDAAPEQFGGPRSVVGARVALAVHGTVAAGLAGWPAGHRDGVG